LDNASFISVLLDTPLLQRAALAGAMAGLCCALLSPLVVLRRMAFIGDGMAHAAFGGMGLALFLLANSGYDDLSVRLLTLLFCLAVGGAIGLASRQNSSKQLSADSAIGIAFSASLALGAMLLALRQKINPQYVPSLDRYLFGSLLNISAADIWLLAALTVTIGALLFLFYKEIFFYAFDAKLAEVSGMHASVVHYLFLLFLALTVVVSARVAGIILISASLILPGVIALKLCARLIQATLLSALIGVASFEAGLFLSYQYDFMQPGSAIVLTQFALLLVVGAWEYIIGLRSAPGGQNC
jgi:zinc transport system permease protein